MAAKLRRFAGLVLWLSAVITILSVWIVNAQQPQRGAAPARRTSTGPSEARDVSVLRLNRVHRFAGSRSFWHSHPTGQIWYIDEGRGYIQERGGRIVELKVGDEPVWTPPNIEHWHGASSDEGGTQVALACCGDNYVNWLDEEVSDAVYKGPRVPRKDATAKDLHSMRR